MISLREKCCAPLLCAMLALGILVGSLSVVTGLCVVSGPEHPEISLDVCHPLQGINLVSTIPLARPAAIGYEPIRFTSGRLSDEPPAKILDLNFAPDPPPPKASA